MRLSIKLSEIYGISRRNAKQYIADGKVRLDGRTIRKDIETDGGLAIELRIEPNIDTTDNKELFISQNEDIIFFYKPPFVHSERHTPEDPPTIEDLVPEGYKLISRLDYETDGIIAAAADGYHIEQMHKVYLAAVEGDFPDSLFMDNKIDAAKRKKVKVLEETGGNAVYFSLRKKYNGISVVEAKLEKATRHQLRAFLAYNDFPIIGDKLYGGKEFPRLMLHCEQTEINGFRELSGRSDFFLSYLKANI